MSKTRIIYLILTAIGLWSAAMQAISASSQYDIRLQTLDEKTVNIKNFVGKRPLYLKLWASWCIPCREQMPHLQETYDKYKEDIEILSVNLDMNDDKASIQKTIREFKLSVPLFVDAWGEFAQSFNVLGTPYHILIDSKGRIVHKGHDASEDLDSKIHLLAKGDADSIELLAPTKKTTKIEPKLKASDSTQIYFFTATWCDWYLKESRPNMAENCSNAQTMVNDIYKSMSSEKWKIFTTRLWTGDKELMEYTHKYDINIPAEIDADNSYFYHFNINKLPTLLVVNKGKVTFRSSQFSDKNRLKTDIKKALQ